MNAKEKTTLDVVANDIKWLMDSSKETNQHLKDLNDSVSKNWTQTMVNKADIKSQGKSLGRQWKVIGGGFTLISGAISAILKGLGVW